MTDGPLLLAAPNTYVLRNWIATGLADRCADLLGVRPVFVSPFADEAFPATSGRRFANHQIPDAPLRGKPFPADFPPHLNALNHVRFRTYAQRVSNGGGQTMTMAARRDVLHYALALGTRIVRHGTLARRAARRLAELMPASHAPSAALFDAVRPAAVLVGTPGMMPLDQVVSREARRRGIPVHCVVNSWDNLTSRGPMHVWPDTLMVWNEHMRDAARRIHEYPAERTHVVGALQFRHYAEPVTDAERSELARRAGLETGEPYVLYLTGAQTPTYEAEDIAALLEAMRGTAYESLPLVVRIHPQVAAAPILSLQHPRIRLDQPPRFAADGVGGMRFDTGEIRAMAALLGGAALVVSSCATTALLEAAVFDRPMVQLRWMDAIPHAVKSEVQIVRRYQLFEHIKPFDATGCRIFSDDPRDLPAALERMELEAWEFRRRRARAVRELTHPPFDAVADRIIDVLRPELDAGAQRHGAATVSARVPADAGA